jgi:hypothetical protein
MKRLRFCLRMPMVRKLLIGIALTLWYAGAWGQESTSDNLVARVIRERGLLFARSDSLSAQGENAEVQIVLDTIVQTFNIC